MTPARISPALCLALSLGLFTSPAFAQGLPFPISDEADAGSVTEAGSASPTESQPVDWLQRGPDLEGTWVVRGTDQNGAYTGELQVIRKDRDYVYVRHLDNGQRDRGAIDVARGMVFLREAPPEHTRGLLDTMHDGDLLGSVSGQRRRLGMFRIAEDGRRLQGRSWLSGEGGGATETLHRREGGLDNNKVDLLIDGPEAFPSIYDAVEGAQSQICLQTFSWFDDDAGERMARLLGEKVAEGVEVRCLIESFPQFGGLRWKTGKLLEELGVKVIIQNKLWAGVATSIGRNFKKLVGASVPTENRGLLTHDHRKLIVVDGIVGFTGGMNIGDKYEQGTTWHDIHCRVEGSAVMEMERLFWDRWHSAGGKGEAKPLAPTEDWPGDLRVDVQENLPGVRLEITESYLEEINGARNEILITNPYMLYDPVVNALKKRASEGVRTVVILPSNDLTDEALARDAFFYIQNDVVNSGVELYKYRDRMTHGKVAVFDRINTTVGTTNLDMMAMERNSELNLFIPDRGFAATTIQRVFDADMPKSDRIAVVKLSWWERVKGFVMHLLRRFL